MKRGILRLSVAGSAAVSAPPSGVHIGTGREGAVSLRLFRVAGTRIVLAARPQPAQLIALRTAASGTPVQVLTTRPRFWEPLLGHDRSMHTISADETRLIVGGPSLVIDDRPPEARGPAELRPWQCRVDIRTQWTTAVLPAFAHTDLALFGAIPAEYTTAVARAFGMPASSTELLARLDSGSFGMLRRGRIEYVSLDPTAAESNLLDGTRSVDPMATTTLRR